MTNQIITIIIVISCIALCPAEEAPTAVNLAPVAEPSTSHVSGDTSLAALHDGHALDWFEIAGQDRNFVKAQAVIDGHTIVVSSDAIAKLTAAPNNTAAKKSLLPFCATPQFSSFRNSLVVVAEWTGRSRLRED